MNTFNCFSNWMMWAPQEVAPTPTPQTNTTTTQDSEITISPIIKKDKAKHKKRVVRRVHFQDQSPCRVTQLQDRQ